MDDKKAKKGNLPTQLNDLVNKGEITPKLKEWADQARIGGRIAAHGRVVRSGAPLTSFGVTWPTLAQLSIISGFSLTMYMYSTSV
jgi:hypothetical protein